VTLDDRRAALRPKPIGANPATRVANGALPGVVNYVRGDSLESLGRPENTDIS
jgi:hypothetical protein